MAVHDGFTVELWVLYGVAMIFTGLRMFARIRSVGLKHLEPDDYLACVSLVFYSAQSGIAHTGSNLAPNGLQQGQVIEPGEATQEELDIRVMRSKLHFSAWPMYISTLWLLKASLLVLYQRLTTGLAGNYRVRILVGFGLLIGTWVMIFLTLLLGCRPFGNYFAESPVGGNVCLPAISKPVVWVCYICNVATDLYLISLPAPMLWMSSMKTWKKVGLGMLFSGGFLLIAFATIRCVLLTTSTGSASPVAGSWAVRESFVAIITANLPMAFTLVKGMLGPTFKSTKGSSGAELKQSKYGYGSHSRRSHRLRGGPNADPTATNALFSESEERIYKQEEALRYQSSPSSNDGPFAKDVPVLMVQQPPKARQQSSARELDDRPLPPLPREEV